MILQSTITNKELANLAGNIYEDMIKAVADDEDYLEFDSLINIRHGTDG